MVSLPSGCEESVLTVQMAAPPPCATELAPISACCSAAPHWLRAEVEKEPAPGCDWATWSTMSFYASSLSRSFKKVDSAKVVFDVARLPW